MITVLKHTLTIKQILTSKGTWYKSYEKHKALIRKHNILRQKIILMSIYQNTNYATDIILIKVIIFIPKK